MHEQDRRTRELFEDRSTRELLAQMWEAEMDRRSLLKRSAVVGAGAAALAASPAAVAATRKAAATAAKLPRTFVYAYSGAVTP